MIIVYVLFITLTWWMVEPVVEDDTYVEYDVVDVDRGGHVGGVLDEVVCVS